MWARPRSSLLLRLFGASLSSVVWLERRGSANRLWLVVGRSDAEEPLALGSGAQELPVEIRTLTLNVLVSE